MQTVLLQIHRLYHHCYHCVWHYEHNLIPVLIQKRYFFCNLQMQS